MNDPGWAKRVAGLAAGVVSMLAAAGCHGLRPTNTSMPAVPSYVLDYDTPCDPAWQSRLEGIDETLRARHGLRPDDAAVGCLDLTRQRLALIRPDAEDYGASVPKIGILLAWFQLRPAAAAHLDPVTRRELGRMIKASSNEDAARFSRELGLKPIQDVLNRQGFYNAGRGGGIWVGKHYGQGSERYGDPVGDHSHAATVRQLVRYYLLLDQGRLISPDASRVMREIFESPEIPHDRIHFAEGLAGRDVHLLRKWGSWQDWRHDSALITGPGRRYILVALTHHPKGEAYLVDLARAVDDALMP